MTLPSEAGWFKRGAWLRTILLGATLVWGGNAMSYEEPDYSVIRESGAVEYRRY